jgi:hypothetical protein
MQQLNIRKIRPAEDRFTACTSALSLLETTPEAAKTGTAGVGILLSPACSSFDRFQNLQQRDERICRSVKSISWGGCAASPKMHGESGGGGVNRSKNRNGNDNFSPRGFLRENHGANEPIKTTSQKGRR